LWLGLRRRSSQWARCGSRQRAEPLAGHETGELVGDVAAREHRHQRQRIVGGQSERIERQARPEALEVIEMRVAPVAEHGD
jgi:hypothetical protein